MFQLHPMIQEFAKDKLSTEESEASEATLRARMDKFFTMTLVQRRQQEPQITRDYWTLQDRLSYGRYADAVSEFIRHHETRPPLSIGITAPWGAGKTSLMRMIQDRLDRDAAANPTPLTLGNRQDRVTNQELLRETSRPEPPVQRAEMETWDEAWRPTVWFNPWQYQSGEQVWAGLAHEIITQITSRLSVGDRERFWLRLNLKRTDQDAVRRRCYRLLVERAFPVLIAFLAALVITVAGLVLSQLVPALHIAMRVVSAVSLTGGTGALLIGGTARAVLFLRSAVTGSLDKLLHEPESLAVSTAKVAASTKDMFNNLSPDPSYTTQLGFLHLVQTDMRRVLDLVVSDDRPLIVFVDDLDRCSSRTVAQVIEAINLFLAGEFPNCVFVLGMEPAAVAAHVEAAYHELVAAEREGRLASGRSTLGWRFLDKIVQLPLSLPAPQADGDAQDYLEALLDLPNSPERAPGPSVSGETTESDATWPEPSTAPPLTSRATAGGPAPADIDALEQEIRNHYPGTETLREITLAAQRSVLQEPPPIVPAARAAAERVYRDLYRDADFHGVLAVGLTALKSTNPREIKRYVNLFRFYTFIAQGYQIDGLVDITAAQTAKLAAFAIRWPYVLSRFADTNAQHPLTALEHAARTDDVAWLAELRTVLPNLDKDTAEPVWATDLRAFLASGTEIGDAAARLI